MRIATLTIEDEAPLKTIPDIPYFSENYAWHGYDYETKTGFFAHIGRWSENRSQWREQMYIYLPDGTTLAYRGVGRGDCSRGASAGVQQQSCVVPGKEWEMHHDGPAYHYTLAQLASGGVVEQLPKRLDFHIRFTASTPVFLYDETGNVTWGRWHMEQMGRIEGSFTFDGREYRMNGIGFRDHSRGPRKLTEFVGNNWIQGVLPDGTGFALFEVWHKRGGETEKALSKATLLTPTSIEPATIISSPGMSSLDEVLAPISVSFESSKGRIDLVGRPLNTVIYAVSDEHNTLSGSPRGTLPFVATEQPVLFEHDGMPVEGHCERCRPLTSTTPLLNISA